MKYASFLKGYNEVIQNNPYTLELSENSEDYTLYLNGRSAAYKHLGQKEPKQNILLPPINNHFYTQNTIENDISVIEINF